MIKQIKSVIIADRAVHITYVSYFIMQVKSVYQLSLRELVRSNVVSEISFQSESEVKQSITIKAVEGPGTI